MVSRIIKVDPFDLVVFGGTGDLAYRKLFPALFRRFLDGQFSEPTRIIAASRHDYDSEAFRATVAKALHQYSPEATKAETVNAFLAMVDYVSLDIAIRRRMGRPRRRNSRRMRRRSGPFIWRPGLTGSAPSPRSSPPTG